jgi:hypothetical protein
MTFVRISLMKGTTAEYWRRVSDVVHHVIVDSLNVPLHDRTEPNDIEAFEHY